MALRAVPDHPKFADLKQRLGISKGAALGYLECVWHFTGRFTPRGNVGKYSDAAIEAWVEWDGEPGALISALIESRWLHSNPEHRVVIHDWPQHADEMVQTTLARNCEQFWDNSMPKSGRLNQHERVRFKEWSDSLMGQSAKSQPKVRQADQWLTDPPINPATAPSKSANAPKPVPEPVPEPVPVPEPTAYAPTPTKPKNLDRDGESWFEDIYTRHPKKGDRGLAQQYLSQSVLSVGFDADEFDRVHKLWCDDPEWASKPQFAPTLAKWILDQGWKYPPQPRRDVPVVQGFKRPQDAVWDRV